MKKEDKCYEEWLALVRERQPMLNEPEELTAAILKRIVRRDPVRRRRKYMIGSWVSGIAVVFVFGMFLNETYFTYMDSPVVERNEYKQWRRSTFLSLPEDWGEMKLLEKSTYLSSNMMHYRQSRQAQISKFAEKTIK